MDKRHIVKAYDRELELLKSKVLEMGQACGRQFAGAIEAFKRRDTDLAGRIFRADAGINALESEIDAFTVYLLAKRQPMAVDLRQIIGALKIAGDLERVADYAANIARHLLELNDLNVQAPLRTIIEMAEMASAMLHDVLRAYAELDVAQAIEVWHRDQRIDQAYAGLLSELRGVMSEDLESIKACTTLLFIAKSCERIGDHLMNVAENVHFISVGNPYRGEGQG